MNRDSRIYLFFGKKLLFDLLDRFRSFSKTTIGDDDDEFEKIVANLVMALSFSSEKNDETFPPLERQKLKTRISETMKGRSKSTLEELDAIFDYVFGSESAGVGPRYEATEKKRRRETDERESESDDGKSAKKRKTRHDIEAELELILSSVPEDLWMNVVSLLPTAKDFLTAGLVSKKWMLMVKRVVATTYPTLLRSSLNFMNSFSDVSEFLGGKLDLSYDDEIDDKTLSKFPYLSELDLRGNAMIGNESLVNMTRLKKLTVGKNSLRATSYSALKDLTDLTATFTDPNSFLGIWNAKKLARLRTEKGWFSIPAIAKLKNLREIEEIDSIPTETAKAAPASAKSAFGSVTKLSITGTWWLGRFPNVNLSLKTMTNLTVLKMPFGVTTINDVASDVVSDDDLSALTNLTRLSIPFSYDEEGAPQNRGTVTGDSLSKLTKLTSLNVDGRGEIVASAFNSLTRLETLKIQGGGRIRIEDVSKLRSLTKLTADYVKGFGANLWEFPSFSNLSKVSLMQTGAARALVRGTAKNENASFERIVGLQLTADAGDAFELDFGKSLPNLERLVLRRNGADEVSVENRSLAKNFFTPLKKLKTFAFLEGNPPDEDDDLNETLAKIVSNGRLEKLVLYHTQYVDDGCIEKMIGLTDVTLIDCGEITSRSLGKLTNLKKLSWFFDPADFFLGTSSPYEGLKTLVNLETLLLSDAPEYERSWWTSDRMELVEKLFKLEGASRRALFEGKNLELL